MTNDPPPPLGPRVRSLIACVLVAIASGTSYVYAVYAPQLVERAHLTRSEAATLSLALSLGGSLGGLPAGIIIDHLGPRKADALGGVLCFASFYLLYWAYIHSIHGLWIYFFAVGAAAFASVISFYSTIKCAATNFPHHRGSAGALPVSGYALASLLYSWISVRFYEGDTAGLLLFFAVFSSLICLGGSYFLQLYDKKKPTPKRRTSSITITERDNLMTPLQESNSVLSFRSMLGPPQRKGSIHKMFSLWGIGRTPSTLSIDAQRPIFQLSGNAEAQISDNSSAIYVPVEDVPVFVKEGSPIWDNEVFKVVRTKLFIKFYIILACMMGVGQTYIYSIGYVVVVLVQSNPSTGHSVSDAQALQVSVIALFSFLGRLTSGPISDVVRRKLQAQRIWCIFFAASLLALGQHLVTRMETIEGLTIASVVIGFAFGFCFGTFPAIIADTFGTDGFTTLWGVMSTSGVLVLMVLCNILADVLKNNSDENGVCTMGAACYSDMFGLTQWMCVFASCLVLYTIWYNHRSNLASTTHDL